jgi:hypothetical protein
VRSICLITVVLTCGMGLARTNKIRVGPSLWMRVGLAPGTVQTLSATPGTISFQSTNPDSGVASGSSTASLTWTVVLGSHLQNWILSVQSGSGSFTGCPTVPVSAVQVSCQSASINGSLGTAGCAGSFSLSSTPAAVASGLQAEGTGSHSVIVYFTLAESWRYVAHSACTLTVTYSVNAP